MGVGLALARRALNLHPHRYMTPPRYPQLRTPWTTTQNIRDLSCRVVFPIVTELVQMT
jgi:hypothetical protein